MEYKPPYLHATLAGLAVFTLYALTLAPTTGFWDASEYIATAHILGIPHPPGNPLFVALARCWSVVLGVFGFPVPVRINLFAAATSAGAAAFWFLVAHRILLGLRGAVSWMPLVGAGAATLISATTYTVWSQSNVNEKVYTLSVLIIALASWLALRWYDRRDETDSLKYLILAGYLMVLGSTSHLMSVLPFPALGLFILIVSPALLLRRAVWTAAVPLTLLAISFNFFLPIRSAQDPMINEGEPSCESLVEAGVAVFTNGRSGCPALAANLTREQYGKPPVTERNAPFSDQLLMYYQYFDWQWARGMDRTEQPRSGRLPVTVLFLVLGVVGLVSAHRSDARIFGYVGTVTALVTIGLVAYLNFKYGYSLAPEVTDPSLHEVRERDYFFIASFSFWGVLAGIGLTSTWDWLAQRIGGPRGALVSAPVLAIALLPLALNWTWASRSGDYAARDWAHDLLMSVEPYGVLFTNGDNDTFPLWYLQEVEGIRQDVTVVVVQYLFTPWYLQQLKRHTEPGVQRAFDPSMNDVFEPPPAAPADPIVALSPEEIDQVQAGRLGSDLTFPIGPIAVSYPEGTFLNRGQLLALRIIRDSLGDRPIFFASFAGIMQNLGLSDWGVRTGLAVKLVPRDLNVENPPGVVPLPERVGAGAVDLPRSLALVERVFLSRGLAGREIWPDEATLNIPLQYYIFFTQLAEGLAQQPATDPVLLDRIQQQAEAFLVTYRSGN